MECYLKAQKLNIFSLRQLRIGDGVLSNLMDDQQFQTIEWPLICFVTIQLIIDQNERDGGLDDFNDDFSPPNTPPPVEFLQTCPPSKFNFNSKVFFYTLDLE